MTTPSGQMPLLMRQEDLATWDNWLSRQETSTLESLLNGGNTPGHAAYIWGSAGMGKSHILQACCDLQGERARYFPLRDFVLHPPEQVLAFETEMSEAGADWQVHVYGSTMHAFTNPAANNPDFGTVYSATAEQRSYQSLENFLAELF